MTRPAYVDRAVVARSLPTAPARPPLEGADAAAVPSCPSCGGEASAVVAPLPGGHTDAGDVWACPCGAQFEITSDGFTA